MPEFVPVIMAALFLLGALYLIYGGVWISEPSKRYGIIPGEEEETKKEAPVGWIGYTPEETLRHIIIGRDFSVAYAIGEETLAEASGTISQGIGTNIEKRASFKKKPDTAEAKIKFFVNDSNYYGQLVFVLNGREIYNDLPVTGQHEIKLNASLLNEENVLEIKASGSGWKFWAPTTYIVNAKVLASYLGIKAQSYKFDLTDAEKKGLTNARLAVSVKNREGNGNLTIKVNGEEVYRDKLERSLIKDFSSDALTKTNAIEMQADEGTKYSISEAEVIVFFRPDVYAIKTMWHNITSSQYSDLNYRNATLNFTLESIVGNPVGLLIKITDANSYAHQIIIQGELREKRSYSTAITKSELAAGSNKIEFIASGQGGFLIVNNTIS